MKTVFANRTVALWPELIPYLGSPKQAGFIISSGGEPITECQYMNLWTGACVNEKAWLYRALYCTLRHTYATVVANSRQVPIQVLQEMMDHAHFQTTMKTYVDFDAEKIRENRRVLGPKYAERTQKVAGKMKEASTCKTI